MRNRLVDQKKVKQVLIDTELHKLLKIKAAEERTTIRRIVEIAVVELLGVVASTPITLPNQKKL